MRHPNTIRELSQAILSGEVTSEEVVLKVIESIEKENDLLRTYISFNKEDALRQAREADAHLRRFGQRSPLHGAPLSVKDIIAVSGYPMTAGSKILSRSIAKSDADCVFECRRAGLVVAGTNNLHEFASGVTSLNPHFGYCRNPWDAERIAGGSSGGSAAAVSAGHSAISLGTDTSGSVRIPASLCGVVGFKPTYGAISTRGVFPLAWSLDHVGILSRSVWDAAVLFGSISLSKPPRPIYEFLGKEYRRLRVAVPWHFFEDLLGREEKSVFERFIDVLSSLDLEVLDVRAPWLHQFTPVWRVIRRAEASAVHKRWIEEKPHLYGEDVLRLLRDGMKYPAVEYIVAVREKEKLSHRFEGFMRSFDAMVMPTTPIAAPKIGEEEVEVGDGRRDIYSVLVALTFPFNVTGSPALSVPIGFTQGGLPLGGQIIGTRNADAEVLRLGYLYEVEVGGFRHRSPLY